jgi:hypothetical protein
MSKTTTTNSYSYIAQSFGYLLLLVLYDDTERIKKKKNNSGKNAAEAMEA